MWRVINMLDKEAWKNCKKILCIRPDNLGDVLMTTPAFKALKNDVPDRTITLLTSTIGAKIAQWIPEIDKVIVSDTPWVKSDKEKGLELLLHTIDEIKRENFDAAVIFTVYSQTPFPAAMLCYMAGIKRVAGYARENPYALITDWIPDPEPLYEIRHEVERQLALIRSLGVKVSDDRFSLNIPENVFIDLDSKLQSLINNNKPHYIVVHPGVSEPKRQYPVHLLAEAAKQLIDEGCSIFITGTKEESPLAEEIVRVTEGQAVDLTGKLNIGELTALISKASLLISNNTGPVHIAAATNTRVVVLYALTNPQHAPWKVQSVILPFEVPEESKSRNIIIRAGNERVFKNRVTLPAPSDIVNAARALLTEQNVPEPTRDTLVLEV